MVIMPLQRISSLVWKRSSALFILVYFFNQRWWRRRNYYLPKGEENKTKAQYLIGFRYMARNDWKETMLTGISSTGNDTSGVERDFVKVLDHMIYHAAH